MEYKVLYRKYRPQSFDELFGQDHIKELLLNSIINEKLSHAYLFTGPRGTGKTSTAKLFAKTVCCESPQNGIPCDKCIPCLHFADSTDIIEIDAASNNGVDEIRELRDNVKILPSFSKYKIYIIDETHMLTQSAWNAFLKTLEEPPGHVIFILATTEVQKVPITVLSRCQRFDFQRITDEVIEEQITNISKKEKIKITKEAITEIGTLAEGSMRDALGTLDQLSKLNTKIDVELLSSSYGVLTTDSIEKILQLLNDGEVDKYIEELNKIKSNGIEPNILLSRLLDLLLQNAILKKTNKECKYNNIENVNEMIWNLENCYNKTNQYVLIKSIFVKHTPVPDIVKITQPKSEDDVKETSEKNISREITEVVMESVETQKEEIQNIEEIVNIRINNAYVDACIKLKRAFQTDWKKFIDILTKTNGLKHLALIKETEVEVVSPTNVIISTEFYSNSVLFNTIAKEVETRLAKELNIDKKIVCLDTETWQKEKAAYIKNKKTKEYKLMPEPEIVTTTEAFNSAELLFGDELVEIN